MMHLFNPRFLRLLTILAAAVFTIAILSSNSNNQKNNQNAVQAGYDLKGKLPQMIMAIDMEKSYDFAGERIPIENFDVRERLERELLVNSYWHSSTILNIKSMFRYFPVIEPILEEYNLPDDFKYLAVAESSLRNETSTAGAKGFWQFMRPTAQYFKLEINSEVDERFNLEKSTRAACKYLLDYKRQFKSWTLAAAAYNMGGPKLKKALGQQKETSYYDMNLNAETNRYVFRIAAIKEILSNPEKFGFILDEQDKHHPLTEFKILEVDGPIENLGDFAKKNGTTYRLLKLYNPWLLSYKLTNSSRKVYKIKIPTT